MKILIQFFICGIFTSFLFPPFFLLPIGFFIFPFLFHLLVGTKFSQSSYRNFFFAGFLYGLGFFIIYIGWIKEPFLIEKQTKNYFFLSYLLIIYCSLYFGAVFITLKLFKNSIVKFLMLPSLVVLAEYICANFLYGFPWTSFSLIYSNNIIGTSLIFYLGSYGLSFIIILFFLFPYIFFFNNKNNKKKLLIFYLIILFILTSLVVYRNSNNTKEQFEKVSVSFVQLSYKINQHLSNENLSEKYDEIIRIIKNNKSEIIIFGENDYPYLMTNKDIVNLQSALNIKQNLIIGSTRKDQNSYFNSFFLINKNTYQKFDKKILVPFGEFIPLRKVFKLMEFIAGTVDFTKGSDQRLLKLNNGITILPVICYEMIYFWKLLNPENKNANLIINLTNDSWFGNFSGPYQHFYFSKLRAAEFNRMIFRVSNNGISGFIDRYGKVINNTNLNERVINNFEVTFQNPEHNYMHIHKFINVFIFLLIALCFIIRNKDE